MYYNKMNYTTNRQNFTVTQRVLILNYDYTLTDTLKMAVGSQTVLRKGKPERKCAVLQRNFNPMLIFSLLISVYVLIAYINGDAPLTPEAPMFLGEPADEFKYAFRFYLFIFLNILPEILYVIGFAFSVRQYKNAEYAITDCGVFLTKGLFSKKLYYKPYREIYDIQIRKEISDSLCKTGTVTLSFEFPEQKIGSLTPVNMAPLKIKNISDYMEVYKLLQENVRRTNYV